MAASVAVWPEVFLSEEDLETGQHGMGNTHTFLQIWAGFIALLSKIVKFAIYFITLRNLARLFFNKPELLTSGVTSLTHPLLSEEEFI